MERPVPMIVGANSMDIGFILTKTKDELFAAFGSNADAARKAYDPEGSADLQMLILAVGGDQFMIEPARFIARKVSDAYLRLLHGDSHCVNSAKAKALR
jgi:para-nitrobenzyl esterase